MWAELKKRIDDNERDSPVALRHTFNEIIVKSDLRPGPRSTKKMVSLEFGSSDLMLWGIEGSATNFYLRKLWRKPLEDIGFTVEMKPYIQGFKDSRMAVGIRH